MGYNENLQALIKASELEPEDGTILVGIGDLFLNNGDFGAAVFAYHQALKKNPNLMAAHNNMGNAYYRLNQLNEALKCYEKALSLDPDHAEIYINIGNIHKRRGEIDNALDAYQKTLTRTPKSLKAYSNLLLTSLYKPDISTSQLLQKHRHWAKSFFESLPVTSQFDNSIDPERKLRIGYLSPDFRTHPVISFFGGMLAMHNRKNFEVYCYFNNTLKDKITEQLEKLSDFWRDVYHLKDSQLLSQIRSDKVDIMVDLAGHSANNRLSVFARRVAPIQVTYLGYPFTTGLDQIDYFITDAQVDPDGYDSQYTEKLVRLPIFSCFQAPANAPEIGPLPTSKTKITTFGSLNNPIKFHDNLIKFWCDILKGVPNSKLMLQAVGFQSSDVVNFFAEKFEQHGVSRQNIIFHQYMNFFDHMNIYNTIDIALDTHPWNGHTTSCHALWMGCPVITMWGNRHSSRMAGSILSAIGLGDLVARTTEEYVAKAIELANDNDRLEILRFTMRDRMKTSPLCNYQSFSQSIESAYLQMWKNWCKSQK